MQAVADKLAPSDARERARSLFDKWTPDIGVDTAKADFKAHEKEIARLRSDAVGKIDDAWGLEGVLQTASEAKLPWTVGSGLADATGARYDEEVVRLLGADDRRQSQFAGAFVTRQFESAGWAWLDDVLLRVGEALTTDQKALLLLASRDRDPGREQPN